jgi:hypothetical protein
MEYQKLRVFTLVEHVLPWDAGSVVSIGISGSSRWSLESQCKIHRIVSAGEYFAEVLARVPDSKSDRITRTAVTENNRSTTMFAPQVRCCA